MKKFLIPIIAFFTLSFTLSSDTPWTADQLYDPTKLAAVIKDSKATKPIIINTGSMRNIKGALKYGQVSDNKGMDDFVAGVTKIDKNKEIVIYCGCCKLDHCPNIDPAYKHLKEKGYKKIEC